MNVILRTEFRERVPTHSIDFHPQVIIKGKQLIVSHVQRVGERYTNNTDILITDRTSFSDHVKLLLLYRINLEINI